MPETYVISLIGCGRISSKHIEAALANKERVRLIACCDPILNRAQRCAQEYRAGLSSGGNIVVYADYHEMLAKEKPSICAIATESGYHPRIAIDCLEAGSHVICEKPMALSTRDADAMIDAARPTIENSRYVFRTGSMRQCSGRGRRSKRVGLGRCSMA